MTNAILVGGPKEKSSGLNEVNIKNLCFFLLHFEINSDFSPISKKIIKGSMIKNNSKLN